MKLKVRCPSCTKLYEVESDDILSNMPVFQCISCDSHFGFEYPPKNPQEVAAFIISTESRAKQNSKTNVAEQQITPPSSMKACPKCGALNGPTHSECYSCHVIFERLEGLPQDNSLRAQPSLVRKWKNLLENFADEKLHDEFIRSCRELDALRFAMMKYEEIKAAQGGDALCDQMMAKINGLMMVELAQHPTAAAAKKSDEKSIRPKWQKYLYWGPYSLSALMILWGVLSLGHRNLIGVGVALTCMTSGLIVMIRGRISLSDFID